MTTEASSRESEAKTEVFAAYQELLGKLKSTRKVTRLDEEKEEIAQREKRQVVESMAKQSPSDVSTALHQLKSLINESLTELETQMVAEQERLVSIRSAITVSNRELEEIYDIRANADTLSALLMAQKEKAAMFEKEMADQRAALERELKEHKTAFEMEIAQKHKELQQQEKEFIYQRDMTREREQAEHEARKRSLEERQAALDARAKQMEDDFVKSMNMEKQRIEQDMRLKFDYEAKLLEKEMESERKVFNQRIATLESKIEHLESLKYSFNKLSFNSLPVDSIE